MKKASFYILGSILLLLNSCAWVSNYIKKLNTDVPVVKKEFKQKNPCAHFDNKLSIYAEEMSDNMSGFLKLCQQSSEQNVEVKIKKCLLNLAVYQMIVRPDQINPSSQVFIMIQKGKNISVYDNKNFHQMGYWKTLLALSQMWNLSSWFEQMVKSWVEKPMVAVKVSTPLVESLKISSKEVMLNNEDFIRNYFRGEELISEGEDLAYNFALKKTLETIKLKNTTVHFTAAEDLEWTKANKLNYSCNFNLQNANNGEISPSPLTLKSKVFAAKEKDYTIAISVYNQSINEAIDNNAIASYFMLPKKDPLQVAPKAEIPVEPKYCIFNWNKKSQLFISSNQGRDPAQYLSHIRQYILNQEPSSNEIEKIMQSPRHLILSTPTRLGFEVDRSTEDQLQALLNLGIPIFNEPDLGHIMISGFLQDKNIFSTDPRGKHEFCSYQEGQKP